MRQHILATALAAALTALAYGQNLNPTVEVTNIYEGGASSIVKPVQKMAVPDSVLRFNLDFDYSVFEKPYQGAYEFTPYYVQLKPTPRPSDAETLYLRLGAGFTLHPELDFVWTPIQKERFQLDAYATHHSYFGRYHRFGYTKEGEEGFVFCPNGEKMAGFLTDTKAGIDATFGWDGGVAMLDASYRHRMADDANYFQKTGGFEVNGRVRSLRGEEPHFLYDADVKYHFLGSDQSYLGADASTIAESWFGLDGTFGPVFSADHRVVADLDLQLARYMGDATGYTGGLALTPKYIFNLDRWHFSLGAKVSWLLYSEDFDFWQKEYRHSSGIIYPDVHVDFHLLDDRLVLQTSATGGDRFHTYSGRFFNHPFSGVNSFGHSRERVRAMLGARGNFGSRFRYDLQAGYARWENAPVEGFVLHGQEVLPALFEQSFNLFFAELDYGWKSESVTVDGRVAWQHAKMPSGSVFAPAAVTGFIRPSYTWGGRLTAGLDVAWSTARYGGENHFSRVPGWVDLGLFAEYRFTHQFGFWVKGGNLLNQVIQRTPVHAEAGMYFTAGILLNF